MAAARYLPVVVALLGACAGAPLESPAPSPPGADSEARLQAILDETVRKGVPAIAARVQTELWSWSGVSGWVFADEREPLTEAHRFRTASVTKLFTEVVIMQMVDEGQLALDDALTDLLASPTVAKLPYAQDITLAQLIDHTSGIRSFTDVPSFWRDAYGRGQLDRVWPPEQVLAYAQKRRPYSTPGEGFYYSSSNYILLGMIIEQVANAPLHQVYRERLFEPLGLHHTFLEGYDPGSSGVLHGYFIPRGEGMNWWRVTQGWQRVREDRLIDISGEYDHYNAWAWAAGGLNSTTGDLALFFNAVREGSLLSEHSRAVVRAHSSFEDSGIDQPRFSYGGSWDGISATCDEIGENMTIIVLMNGTGIDGVSQQSVLGDIYRAVIGAG